MTFLRLALSLFLVLLHAAGTASPTQSTPVADDPCGRFGKLFSVAVGLYGATNEPNSFEGHTLVHTRVLTDTGYQTRLKPIADIQIGDEVLAWDELQAHDNAAVLKQASLEEKEAVFRRGYSIVRYDNNSNSDTKVVTSASTKAVVSTPSAQRYEKVTDTFSSVKQQTLLHITLSNGQTLQATAGHPFKTSEGWRDAILLKKGGKLLLKGGDADDATNTLNGANPAERYTTITDIRTEVKTLPVFNLEVANLHTFFVGTEGVVVHNGERPPNLSPPGAGQNGAFREAKRFLGIPMSAPCKVGPAKDRYGKLTGKREYDFGSGKVIRQDPPHNFGPGNKQNRGDHFNTPDGSHFDF
jgi:Pretoxin HINT domain